MWINVHPLYAVWHEGQKRTSEPPELELQAVVSTMWRLGTEPMSFIIEVSALKHWAISPALRCVLEGDTPECFTIGSTEMDGGECLWSAAKKWDRARAIGQWESAC